MGGSRLEIAGRTIARCNDGALEAEYALFEPVDIELKATEPGRVREIGYLTTAERARVRLEHAGVNEDMAQVAAGAMRPLASVYARGSVARRVAKYFGPAELFEGRELDARAGAYSGAWMDLAALAKDLGLRGGVAAMQALHLYAILAEAKPDAVVMLHTIELTGERRPGERTYQRVALDGASQIAAALRLLAERSPGATKEREAGPTRIELLEAVRDRQTWCVHAEAQARLARIEGAASVREQPAKGPLADPDLWVLDLQMNENDATGVMEKLDLLERQRGRTPATTYLRARAALMRKLEEPAVIAARVSALALSMSNFSELGLLAAQAWIFAGDLRRAAPYARDLMENASVDPEVRARAEGLFREASAPRPAPSSQQIRPPIDDEKAPDTTIEPAPIFAVSRHATMPHSVPTPRPPGRSSPPPANLADSRAGDGSVLSLRNLAPSQRPSAPYSAIGERTTRPSNRPKRRSSPPGNVPETSPERDLYADNAASVEATPPVIPDAAPTPVRLPSDAPPRDAARPARRPSAWPPGLVESRGAGWSDARAEPDDPPAAPIRTTPTGGTAGYMKGASQPPFRTEEGHAEIPRGASPPRFDALHSEAAEYLSLPRNATGEPPMSDAVPRTVLEARVLFTHLSRELGREYRVARAVELRSDANAIEAMQAHLFDAYHAREVRSLEDWLDVRRHGAFLSEILLRTLGAEWTDIAPRELGYWAMTIPPGTRVWPFARVLRYVAMGPKERDLVSYYLELKTRAHKA